MSQSESMQDTPTVVEEVVETFKQGNMSAEQLREIADQLAGSVQYFHVE